MGEKDNDLKFMLCFLGNTLNVTGSLDSGITHTHPELIELFWTAWRQTCKSHYPISVSGMADEFGAEQSDFSSETTNKKANDKKRGNGKRVKKRPGRKKSLKNIEIKVPSNNVDMVRVI